jgi:hypothetical protein
VQISTNIQVSPRPVMCVPEGEAARLLTVSRALLRKWRRVGGGPPWLKVGRCVRYPLLELQNFLEKLVVKGS